MTFVDSTLKRAKEAANPEPVQHTRKRLERLSPTGPANDQALFDEDFGPRLQAIDNFLENQ